MEHHAAGDFHEQDADQGIGRITFTDWVRARAEGLLDPLARLLGRLGAHPDTVTVLGFLLQVGVSVLFARSRVQLGGVLLSVIAPLDALDGTLARTLGEDGPFGAFLDSTLDRLSDAGLVLGLVIYHFHQEALLEVGLLLVALIAALMVSYTRARAESLGISCRVGLLTRLERVVLIAGLSTLGLTTILAWVLAPLSVLTFLQRILHVHRASSTVD